MVWSGLGVASHRVGRDGGASRLVGSTTRREGGEIHDQRGTESRGGALGGVVEQSAELSRVEASAKLEFSGSGASSRGRDLLGRVRGGGMGLVQRRDVYVVGGGEGRRRSWMNLEINDVAILRTIHFWIQRFSFCTRRDHVA